MTITSTYKLIIGAAFMLASAVVQATVINVNFRYTGSTLFNMTGSLSYDEATVGPVVDKSELLSFQFDVFDKLSPATPLFGYTLGVLSRIDNYFSFDAINQRLVTSPGSQRWGMGSSFFQIPNPRAGIKGQGLIMSGNDQDFVLPQNLSTALQYNVTAVPEPEAYGMLLLGLGLIGVVVRRRRFKQ